MAITLAGKITDITNRSPDQVTRATVKYPTYTIGEAGALATSAPHEVTVAADGSFTLDVTPGKGWLFLEGPGWSESVGFIAASGMSLFIEAVANLDASPIYDLIRELIDALGGTTEAELQALVEQARIYADAAANAQATGVAWDKGTLTTAIGTLDNAPIGVASVSFLDAPALGAPVAQRGTVRTTISAGFKFQTYTTTVAGVVETWARSHDGTAWSAWKKQFDTSKMWNVRGQLDAAKANDKLADGVYIVPFDVATAAGLPRAERGMLESMLAQGFYFETWRVAYAGKAEIWTRFHNGTAWSEWTNLSAPAAGSQQVAASSPASGMKQVGLPLCAGHSDYRHTETAGTVRMPFTWLNPELPITRIKVRIRNQAIRSGTVGTGTHTIDGVWLGAGTSAGVFDVVPANVGGVGTISGGSVYETRWIDVPGGTLAGKVLSFSFTSTEAPFAQLGDCYTSTDRVGANVGAVALTRSFLVPFTVDLIVETYRTTPVIAVMGDSNSVGVGAKAVSEAWGVRLAHKLQAIPQLFGGSGDTLQGSADGTAFKWQRFAGFDRADVVLMAMGQNDAGDTKDTTLISGWFTDVMKNSKLLADKFYGISMMPRTNDPTAEFENRRKLVNSWYEAQRDGSSGFINTIPAMSSDNETIMPEFDSDGTHLNAAGFEAVATHIKANYAVTTPPVQYQAI